MKKKKVFSKILAIVLVLSLMLSAFPSISVFAQEVSSKEKLTEKGELWQPESNPNELNFGNTGDGNTGDGSVVFVPFCFPCVLKTLKV